MAEVRWTDEAQRWLRDIYEYIAPDNPEAAQKVVAGIYERSQILRRFPDIGYRYRTEHEGDIRILFYGHYRIAYLVTPPRPATGSIWLGGARQGFRSRAERCRLPGGV